MGWISKPPEEVFVECLAFIEETVRLTARRHGASEDEAAEFSSWAKLKLVEDGYARIAKCRQQTRMRAFLRVVIQRLFQDFRIHRWGKWRPSVTAKRLGPRGIDLERLTHRDGCTLDEAIEAIATRHGVEETRTQLAEIARRLPHRQSYREVGGEDLDSFGDTDSAEDRVLDAERNATVARTSGALNRALAELSEEQRVILKMYYGDGVSVPQICRMFDWKLNSVYWTLEQCKATLRERLEAEGIDRSVLQDVLGWDGELLEVEYGVETPKTARSGPSG